MRKLTNTSPSPKGFKGPKISDSDFREVRGLGLNSTKSDLVEFLPIVTNEDTFMSWAIS
jgi:hypothetical protein